MSFNTFSGYFIFTATGTLENDCLLVLQASQFVQMPLELGMTMASQNTFHMMLVCINYGVVFDNIGQQPLTCTAFDFNHNNTVKTTS